MRKFKAFARRSLVLLIAIVASNPISLLAIGIANRLLGGPLASLFVGYPGEPGYCRAYAFQFMLPWMRDAPFVVGLFRQGGRTGVISVISASEADFQDDAFLAGLHRHARRVARLLGVGRITYSGVLPTALRNAGLLSAEFHRERCALVGRVVISAEAEMRARLGVPGSAPVILLGGGGSVGRAVAGELSAMCRPHVVVEAGEALPAALRGGAGILINLAHARTLAERLNEFWPSLVVLNEAYPEPSSPLLAQLEARGVTVYHITGVAGTALPPFPRAYAGGIPCCAAHDTAKLVPVTRALGAAKGDQLRAPRDAVRRTGPAEPIV